MKAPRPNPAPPGAFTLATFTVATLALAAPAWAQPVEPAPDPAPVVEPALPAPAATAAEPAAPVPRRNPLRDALASSAGGLTEERAAERAVATSKSVEARRADVAAASAQVDRALVSYFPRLTLTASYTRVSDVDSGIDTGGGALLGAANAGPITTGPCPGDPATTCVIDSGGLPVSAQQLDFSFPTILNNYQLTASLVVPISDYILRLTQAYQAASLDVSAKDRAHEAERLKIAADAKVAFYQWVRAKGQTVVAGEAIGQAQAHVGDAKKAFEAGLVARADVLRLEAQVARAEQLLASAGALELTSEEQLRALMHAPSDERLVLGVDVFANPRRTQPPPLGELVRRAHERRLELKSAEDTQRALEEVESATDATYLPRIEAFATGIYANPNPRIFPQEEEWNFTWEVGARVIWVVNETFSTIGASSEAEARVASASAQREALKDAIRMEVTAAYAEVVSMAPSIAAAEREVEAAEESLRVRRALYQFGKATTADLLDAETELTRARLAWLDAHIRLRVAWVRLEHAVGGDLRG